jgi:hypothetical protein
MIDQPDQNTTTAHSYFFFPRVRTQADREIEELLLKLPKEFQEPGEAFGGILKVSCRRRCPSIWPAAPWDSAGSNRST